MTAPRPVSGDVHELRRGAAVARIGSVAAVLREFSVAGTAYTEVWDDADLPPMGCGLVLVPWPNRVAGGRYEWQGQAQQLDLTEPSRGNATHGLLRNTPYTVSRLGPDAVTLTAPVYPQHGYPFLLDTSVTYRLTDAGLDVTHEITNAGTVPAPFGVGAHPYLRVGAVPVGELTLTLAAATMATADDRLIPTGLVPVDGTPFDLRAGRKPSELTANTAFTDLALVDGLIVHRLAAPDGSAVELWAEPAFGWAQVFTPDNFPAPGHPEARLAVAVEPMTCSADAFNNGWGLLTVEPGQTWSGSWGITPV